MAEKLINVELEARFNAILDEYGLFLRRALVRICPKDLGIHFNDLEQEARMRIWRALQHEKELHDPASYLYRVAMSVTLDAIRRIKAKREVQLRLAEDEDEDEGATLVLPSDPHRSPELETARRQLVDKVRTLLAGLPDNRRRAVGLHLEGLNSREIADLLGWSEAKARNLLYRGLHDLRVLLRAEGVEYEIDD
ncbi:MAG TPA: RNA polymerase sigma factor [Blastocatellia bacterium]|nr:RNA polymerase sigma factor [Blastocatellia bacterium]